MKVTFIDKIEHRTALSRKMYCGNCGSHMYDIHYQLQPYTGRCCWVECNQCGHATRAAFSRKVAIKRWQNNEM